MKTPTFATVRSRDLSLWQAAVSQTVRQAHPDQSPTEVSRHPRVQATRDYALAQVEGQEIPRPKPGASDGEQGIYLSKLHHRLADARVNADTKRVAELEDTIRKYSGEDPGWIESVTVYDQMKGDGDQLQYRDWQTQGNQKIDYSLISYQLPSTCTVALMADWGTGLDDAVALLKDVSSHSPDAILHLGDIYYAGTVSEVQEHVLDVMDTIYPTASERPPFFAIPGNHEYYAFGYGFVQLIDGINGQLPNASQYKQDATFFCLRTEDDNWQFLGMDTGQDDSDPNPGYHNEAPGLRDSEVFWHWNKLDTFSGSSILLSHHQVFSANQTLCGTSTPYLNNHLKYVFQDYLASDVVAWFWGHEHNLVIFEENQFDLKKGRLIGDSGYEEMTSDGPYQIKYSQVAYKQPVVELSASAGYYDHGYVILHITPSQITAEYYDFPSWGNTAPPSPTGKVIFTETFTKATVS